MKKIIRYAALCCASFLALLGGTACGGGNFNPPHTHVFEKTKTVAPTCEEKGYVISKCSCGEETCEENAEALGHKLTNCVLDKAGKTTTSCARKDCDQAVSIEKPYAEIFQTNGNTIVGFTEEAKKMYTSIYLPTKIDGVEMTAIGASAFTKNETLVDVVIPQGYVSIGDQAFSNCEKLTYCTLGNSIDSIGAWSFYNSKKLSKVTYIGEKSEWDHVKRGTYWNNATAVIDAVCSRDGLSVYSEIALNGKTIDGTMTANFDYAYDKVTGIFTNNSGATKSQGFYPLKATDDYILRVQMGGRRRGNGFHDLCLGKYPSYIPYGYGRTF